MGAKSWQNEQFFLAYKHIPHKPVYYGGEIASRGFNYQAAYTCLRLIDVLDRTTRLKALRVEGLQDLDLKFSSSGPEEGEFEEYVQVKDVADRWIFSKLAPIIYRFLEVAHLVGESHREQVRFRLVVGGRNEAEEVKRLRTSTLTNKHKAKLLKFILRASTDKGDAEDQKTADLESNSLKNQLNWLLAEERFTFEHHGYSFERRPVALSEVNHLIGPNHETNADFAGWMSSDEALTKDKLLSVLELKHSKSQDAFNALRAAVIDALAGIEPVFNRDRLLAILRPYVAASTFEGTEGVRLIDEKFFEIQKQEAEKEDQALLERERRRETIQFYQRPFRGKRARWQDIAADRDFVRVKQQVDLDKEIVKRINPEHPQGLVITGQRGEGKSALWMRTAKRWLSERQAFVYEIRNPDKFNNHLDQLARLAKSYTRDHLILLLGEDIYGTDWDEWKNLCRSLNDLRLPQRAAPILFLATAPTDTIPKSNSTLDGFLQRFSLQGVTLEDKREIGRNAGLSETQIADLDDRRFLVAVLQATEGKGFEDIVHDWVLYSKSNFGDSGYPCLLALCLVSSLDLNTPVNILNKLGYANCIAFPERHGLEGNVFVAPSKGLQWDEWIEGPHAVLAEEFVRQSLSPYEISERYKRISAQVEPASLPERRFFIHLLRRVLRRDGTGGTTVGTILQDHISLVQQCQANSSIRELSQYWPQIYRAVGMKNQAEHLREKALTSTPIDRAEVVLLAELLEANQDRDKALEMLKSYVAGSKADAHVWSSFLDLLSRRPREKREFSMDELEVRQEQLRRAESWLFKCEQPPVQVWIQYLRLAAECGGPEDYRKALGEVSTHLPGWYQDYPDVWANVCEKYLELLSRAPKAPRQKTKEEYADRQAVLRKVEEWIFNLERPPAGVWINYLGLAHKYGTGKDRDKALREVAARLDEWRDKYRQSADQIFEKYLHDLDEWREKEAKRVLQKAVNSGEKVAEVDSIISEWTRSPRIAEVLRVIKLWADSPNLLPQLLNFTVHWGTEADWRTVFDHAVDHLEGSTPGSSKDLQKIWVKAVAAVSLRGRDPDRQRLIVVGRRLIEPPPDEGQPLPIPWWVKFLSLLRLAIETLKSESPPIYEVACSLACGPVPGDKWEALKRELNVEWRDPGPVLRNETVLDQLGVLLTMCPSEALSAHVQQGFADLCHGFPRAKLLQQHIASIAAKAGMFEAASNLYEKLVDLYPKDTEALHQYAKVCLARNQYPEAEELLKKALSLNPKDTDTHVSLLTALEGQGKAREAEQERKLIEVFNAIGPYPYGSSLAVDDISDC